MTKYADEGIILLSSAIIKQAIRDVYSIDKKITKGKKWSQQEKIKLELFFGSQWFETLAMGQETQIRQELYANVNNSWFFERKTANEFTGYKPKRPTYRKAKVKAVNTQTGEERIYNTQTEASKDIGVSISRVNFIIGTEKTTKGWKVSKYYERGDKKENTGNRKGFTKHDKQKKKKGLKQTSKKTKK